MKISEDFKKEIAPFFWSEYSSLFSVCLNTGDYLQEVFDKNGAIGNGYDWERLAKEFL